MRDMGLSKQGLDRTVIHPCQRLDCLHPCGFSSGFFRLYMCGRFEKTQMCEKSQPAYPPHHIFVTRHSAILKSIKTSFDRDY